MKQLSFFLLIIPLLTYSQNRNEKYHNGAFNNNIDFFAMAKVQNKSNSNYLPGIKGTPYLYNTWNNCKIYPSDSKPNFSIPCNYNVYADQFEIKVGDDLYILNPESVKSLIVDQKTFIPYKGPNGGEFIELLGSNKKIRLIRIYKAKIMSVQTSTLGLHESKLNIASKDYFLTNDGELVKLPKSKSKIFDILNLTNAQKKTFKNYNLKKTDQLITIMNSI